MEKLIEWLNAVSGRRIRLAVHLGVKPPVVSEWVTSKRSVPMVHAAAIEKFTGGAVTRRELFPETYAHIWPELADELPTEEALAARANVAAEQGAVDRRNPASVNPFPDLDRRAVGQGV
jgi:DNA-binding transcriptional regulator YdaS (Cro superfamily)